MIEDLDLWWDHGSHKDNSWHHGGGGNRRRKGWPPGSPGLDDDDCNNALGRSFTRDVNRMKQRKFSSSRNWLGVIVHNDCANDAVEKELESIGDHCSNSGRASSHFHHTSDQM